MVVHHMSQNSLSTHLPTFFFPKRNLREGWEEGRERGEMVQGNKMGKEEWEVKKESAWGFSKELQFFSFYFPFFLFSISIPLLVMIKTHYSVHNKSFWPILKTPHKVNELAWTIFSHGNLTHMALVLLMEKQHKYFLSILKRDGGVINVWFCKFIHMPGQISVLLLFSPCQALFGTFTWSVASITCSHDDVILNKNSYILKSNIGVQKNSVEFYTRGKTSHKKPRVQHVRNAITSVVTWIKIFGTYTQFLTINFSKQSRSKFYLRFCLRSSCCQSWKKTATY